MNRTFTAALGQALERTRAADPMAATRIIQAALAGRPLADDPEPSPARKPAPRAPSVEDAEVIADQPLHAEPIGSAPRRGGRRLATVIAALRSGRARLLRSEPTGKRPPAEPEIPAGARWEWRRFANAAGARDYRLYVPGGLAGAPRGLIVMLHGCTQGADDFACGTRMNAEAERHGLIVAYPEQGRTRNAQACWNWFRPGDQQRAAGEPALLAGLAESLATEFAIDRTQVFAAGLSAGGAMVATLAATHPDVFRAVGIHSGLPHGAAHNVVSAFAAMRGEGGPASATSQVPVIVFHGTADTIVHPSNAGRVLDGLAGDATRSIGTAPGGRRYERHVTRRADGTTAAELWLVEGAGHAWSGGDAAGSYTDPAGPDASTEMVRFFLDAARDGLG